jgi:chaperone modulatory protein CbpM
MTSDELLILELDTGVTSYSLDELCRIARTSVERIALLVEFGILEPEGTGHEDWRFAPHALPVVRRAHRLTRDLGLDAAGVALALELLEEVETLRREVAMLRAQLARITVPR